MARETSGRSCRSMARVEERVENSATLLRISGIFDDSPEDARRVWLPERDMPLPAPSRFHSCSNGTLRLPGRPPVHALCLGHDGLSDGLRLRERHADCDELVSLWRWRSSIHHSHSHQHAHRLFLEYGANLGFCTLSMLVETDAVVFAFEPSPINLFHLTTTLSRAVAAHPRLRHRVAVFPFAVGNATGRAELFVASTNLGNSVVGYGVKDWGKRGQQFERHPISVRALDDLFRGRRFGARLLKMDVQGSEVSAGCRDCGMINT